MGTKHRACSITIDNLRMVRISLIIGAINEMDITIPDDTSSLL